MRNCRDMNDLNPVEASDPNRGLRIFDRLKFIHSVARVRLF